MWKNLQEESWVLFYLSLIPEDREREKFLAIYDAYHNLMLYIAYQILDNQQDAEDAVHEALLRIIEILEKISDPVCPKTRALVGIITRGKAVDLYRARKRRCAEPWEEWTEPTSDRTLAEVVETADPTLRAMAQLPVRQRELLMLKYDQGFHDREIAHITGMSQANVAKTLQRAKARLRELLMEQGVEV